jgi:sugar fermentation stimulation protein A
MRYHSQLIEATLLKRPISFLVEAVLQSKRRIMVRCPNLGPLTGCDILGTQIWFSAPSGEHCLPTLELVEVNGGFLVGVNQEILQDLAIESIGQGYIKELSGYKVNNKETPYSQDTIFNLSLQKDLSSYCYICLEHVLYANERYEAIFTGGTNVSDANLEYLSLKKKQGNRAILLYCVLHSGAKCLSFQEEFNNCYANKISAALSQGIEILAYKATISTQEILLNNKIPLIFKINTVNNCNNINLLNKKIH